MVKRRGLGATMVASVALSFILVAGLGVYVASLGREGLYSTADSEDYLGDEFQVLSAAGGSNILLALQTFVASRVLACPSALGALSQEAASLRDVQAGGNVTVVSRATLATGTGSADGIPGISPYSGAVPGELNVALAFSGTGSSGPEVALNRTETHYAHLPVGVVLAVRDCGDAVAAIEKSLALSGGANCTSAAVGPLIQAALREPAAVASADGFRAEASYSLTTGPACDVTFNVRLEQGPVPGPGGNFTARFEGGGTVALAG